MQNECLMVSWQEGHLVCKKTVPLIPKISVLELVEEDPRKKQPLNGTSSSSSMENPSHSGIKNRSMEKLQCLIKVRLYLVSCMEEQNGYFELLIGNHISRSCCF